MNNTFLILAGAFLFLSCSKRVSENVPNRLLSAVIKCDNDSECFTIVDSLLVPDEKSFDLNRLEWNELSRSDTIINFHEYTNLRDHLTILVADNVEAESAGNYIIRLGSDDGFRIFVNGEYISSRIIGRALQLDNDWIPVYLKKGNNQIVIQVNQGTGDWKLHYRIDKGENLKNLIQDQIIEIYRDLPDLNILNDSLKVLTLNMDLRQKLDTLHYLSYEWIDPFISDTTQVGIFSSVNAPLNIKLPENHEFPLLFRYSLFTKEGEDIFSETIPIFSDSALEKYVRECSQKLKGLSKTEQWKTGLELIYPEIIGAEKRFNYSTRTKTEFLWDLMIRTGYEFPVIGGPRVKVNKGLLSRVYLPDNLTEKTVKVFGVNPQPEDTLDHYMETYHSRTHNTLMVRSSYARYFNLEMTFPFIKQYTETNNLKITLGSYVDGLSSSEKFNIIAWSNSVPLILEELGDKKMPVVNVAILGSFLGNDPTERFITIQKIRLSNPNIQLYIWHGEEDERVPISVMEEWVQEFKKQGFIVIYERLPLTDHEVYFIDAKKKFYKAISTSQQNEGI